MIAKLRQNFRLTSILARIAFVLCFAFANWQTGVAASMAVLGQANIYLGLASIVLLGIIVMFIIPLLANLVLNFARIYSVPRAEYSVLAYLFASLGYLLLGLMNIVNFFTPVMLVWGSAIFPFVSSFIAAILFYKVTAKLYFNDVTVVNYFRVCAITYLVILVILEVL